VSTAAEVGKCIGSRERISSASKELELRLSWSGTRQLQVDAAEKRLVRRTALIATGWMKSTYGPCYAAAGSWPQNQGPATTHSFFVQSGRAAQAERTSNFVVDRPFTLNAAEPTTL